MKRAVFAALLLALALGGCVEKTNNRIFKSDLNVSDANVNLEDLNNVADVVPDANSALKFIGGIWTAAVDAEGTGGGLTEEDVNSIGLVPYVGAHSPVDLGSQDFTTTGVFYGGDGVFSGYIYDSNKVNYIDLANGWLYDGTGTTVDWVMGTLEDGGGTIMVDWITGTLEDGTGTTVDWITGTLEDGGGAIMVDWITGTLEDGTGTTVDWVNGYLEDGAGAIMVEWMDAFLNDTVNNLSIDWDSRTLHDSSGTEVADYSGTSYAFHVDGNLNVRGSYHADGTQGITTTIVVEDVVERQSYELTYTDGILTGKDVV